MATTEAADPLPGCGNQSRASSVWYRFTAPSSGTVSADTFGSTYDTILSAYTGSPGTFVQVACNDDFGSYQSQVSFPVNAGTEYSFMISSFSGNGGALTFHLSLAPDKKRRGQLLSF
jgi:hypothetical protein